VRVNVSLARTRVTDGGSFLFRSIVITIAVLALVQHLQIAAAEQDPIFGAINSVVTHSGAEVAVPLEVFDPDTALVDLEFSARTAEEYLVRSVNFVVDGTNVVARIRLHERVSGTEEVTISVSDGITSVSQLLYLTAMEAQQLIFVEHIPDQVTQEDEPLWVLLRVDAGGIPLEDLTFFGAPVDSNLVSSVEFSTLGAKVLAKVIPATNAFGTTRVRIWASDGTMVTRSSFNLQITPVADRPTLKPIFLEGRWYLRLNGGDRGKSYSLETSVDFTVWERRGTVIFEGNPIDVLLMDSRPIGFWQARKD
jgi:hypothetical protein